MAAGKWNKLNSELFKRVFEVRPLYTYSRCESTQAVPRDMFKFYSDETVDFGDRFRVLDEQDYTRFLSQRALRREPALTRLITSLAYKVGKQMLSLAEGMPNEQMFPFRSLQLRTRAGGTLDIEDKELATALQYVPSQGLPSLLTELRSFQQELHNPPPLDRDVLTSNGAQHGIYQCVDMLVDPGDPVLTTEYTYTGMHIALKPYYPEILGIPEDENGIIVSTLESVLQDRLTRGLKMPRILYLIPTGNNPTGTVLPADRRRRIYELACQYDFLIIEDDPYMFLNFSEERPPSFLSLDACGRVVRLDSASKVLSAGLRAAWLTAPTALARRAELHAQAELLHPCALSQTILYRLLSHRDSLAAHLTMARDFYSHRRDALRAALRGVSELADWAEPSAGLFYWLRVRGVDDVYNMVFHTAFQRGLMLIPGHAFQYDTRAPCPYLRLTFSKIPLKDMDAAVRNLADVIRDEQKLKTRTKIATEG